MNQIKTILVIILLALNIPNIFASHLLIPMDLEQANHLKAYGIAYYAVSNQIDMSWYWLLLWRYPDKA